MENKIIKRLCFCLSAFFIHTSHINASELIANCPRLHSELMSCVDCEQKTKVNSILAIGNSITWKEKHADIGWLNNWGMAASSEDRDWVHLLQDAISNDQNTDVNLTIWKNMDLNVLSHVNLQWIETEWGRMQDLSDYEVIFIQIGGNALNTKPENFEIPYKKLLDFLKQKSTAKIFLLSTWSFSSKFPDANEIIQALSNEYSAAFIDISFLSGNPDFLAKNEPICLNGSLSESVCLHPGDKGMEAIAFEICHQNHVTKFNELNGELIFEDVLVDSIHFSATLKNQGDLIFSLTEHKMLGKQSSDSHSAAFDPSSNAVISHKVQAFKDYYNIVLKKKNSNSDVLFKLEKADKSEN